MFGTHALLTVLVDEETKAEYEEMQKKGILGMGGSSSTSNAAQSFQNFDLASWMAGSSSNAKSGTSDRENTRR